MTKGQQVLVATTLRCYRSKPKRSLLVLMATPEQVTSLMQAVSSLPYQLSAPEPFTFEAERWKTWKPRWECFRSASGSHLKPTADRVNSLIYLMGPKAEDIYTMLTIPTPQAKSYSSVIQAFEAHFIVKTNIAYERAMFNSRVQKDGEQVSTANSTMSFFATVLSSAFKINGSP